MRNKLLTLPFLLLTGMVFFVSCKKDDFKGGNTSRVIAEFKDGLTGGSASMEFSSNIVTVDLTELQLYHRSDANKGPIKVKVAVKAAAVADYNTANGTSYAALPTSAYSLESDEVTLTQTERSQWVRIKIRPTSVVGGNYAIGLTIAEVNGGLVSQDKFDVVVTLAVKNAYEGDYHSTGLLTVYNGPDVASGISTTYTIDEDKYLSTIDNVTSEVEVGYFAFTGGYMYMVVNPSNNQVTVGPSFTAPTFNVIQNNGTCAYNPGTKTFTLNYKYFNGAGNLRVISEVMVGQ